MIKAVCMACPWDAPCLFLNKKLKWIQQMQLRKKNHLRHRGTCMFWSKKHESITKHSEYSMLAEHGTPLYLSEMVRLTGTSSQMLLMKQSLFFLKNGKERILAPSLKDIIIIIIIIIFSPAYLQSRNNNRSIAPFSI